MSEPTYRFGRFRLESGARQLLRDGEPIALGARAFDILHLLLRHHDRFVPREEITHAIWPRSIVEDSNLTVHISSLRKILDKDMIQTVPGRGYRLATPVEIEAEARAPPEGVSAPSKSTTEVASRATRARNLPWIAAALAIIAGAALLALHNRPEPWSSTERRASNVILSVDNLSGDPALDQVARQFTDAALWMLSDNYLLTATTYAVDHATQLSAAELQEIGRRFDSHFVIAYGLRKEGDGISLNATVTDARTGARVATQSLVTTAYQTLADQRIEIAELAREIAFAELAIEAADAERLRPEALDAWDWTCRAFLANTFSEGVKSINRARELAPDALVPLWLSAQLRSFAVRAGESADPAADTKRALAEINRAFLYRPSSGVIAGARALVLHNLGMLDQAWNAYGRVLELAPGEPFAHGGRAEIALRRGRLDEARRELEAMGTRRQTGNLLLGAELAFTRGDYEEAIQSEDRAIAMWGEAANFAKFAKLIQASSLQWLGREAEAKAKLASALAPQPAPDWWPGTRLSELRAKREVFAMPDEAWDRLVRGLQDAGMAE